MDRYNRFMILKYILSLFKRENIRISKCAVGYIVFFMSCSTVLSIVSPYLYSVLVDDVMIAKNIDKLFPIIALMTFCFISKSLFDIINS